MPCGYGGGAARHGHVRLVNVLQHVWSLCSVGFQPNAKVTGRVFAPDWPPSTLLRTGPSTLLRTGPSTGLRTGPSTLLRTGPSTGLRAGPSTGLRAGFETTFGLSPSTLLRAGFVKLRTRLRVRPALGMGKSAEAGLLGVPTRPRSSDCARRGQVLQCLCRRGRGPDGGDPQLGSAR